ncbi:hypothetical protein GALMADRAFT_210023 [Galerina marginata CBS 339.88]|uniref:Uncharacterized protein n=1 Tax=Galerina marginata (strain CBS 339.88) TaxID=685588 RepID=A0A067T3Q7_GALM3|nr:hypothetical protein GALMADRAFT_210023 [Galerina marginata CBS 339.88]
MAINPVSLAAVFGGEKSIGDMVKGFDFSKMDVKDDTRNDHLHLDLAPSYGPEGKLTSAAIKCMDDNLKIMIAGTMKSLSALKPEDRSWANIMSTLMQNPLLEPETDAISRSDKLIKSGTNVFKFDGSPDATIVNEVQAWFVGLISDKDVLDSTKIDIHVLGEIVAQTGATVDSFETFFGKKERHEKTIVDIGVLRFPDQDRPHFQVYRIQLHAWSQSNRVLFVQEDTNGITGEYYSRNFKPRDSVIVGLRAETKQKAIQQAEDMFA